ncbi:SAM-dependent methyltransferase [Corallococcus sp. AB030]|uniref:class I SAM-dependent methyltransferase n=1 Tax=unclassified Corallococcus TaxID=2685029 RepID=UPI000EBF99A9|nr:MULTISPECIES: class I SAM-dependent methyltransferase [unclassified Corallococcus]RKI11417.1 SAM-dependent methyltransferase [Corallococcus sp. AB030]RUO91520.1 SAM-dependent methyltransferase [Corallococcus sp. AB018]
MRNALMAASLLVLAGCSHSTPTAPASSPQTQAAAVSAQALVDAPDRTEADRKLDAGRHPAALLEFVGVKSGMHVAELMAGGGYTTELLARAVGPEGKVYGENPKVVLERFAEKPWQERLARPMNQNVVRLDRELDAPFPPEMNGTLDAVVSHIIYHDTGWLGVDRAKMNAAVFQALKPGGVYVILDSSAKAGTGITEGQTLHRIDEQLVRDEVQAAGFQFQEENNTWRNPEDTRDWSSSPGAAGERRGTSDRFAFKFVKP